MCRGPEVAGLFSKYMSKLRKSNPERIMSDFNLKFIDAGELSSDSEMEDIMQRDLDDASVGD